MILNLETPHNVRQSQINQNFTKNTVMLILTSKVGWKTMLRNYVCVMLLRHTPDFPKRCAHVTCRFLIDAVMTSATIQAAFDRVTRSRPNRHCTGRTSPTIEGTHFSSFPLPESVKDPAEVGQYLSFLSRRGAGGRPRGPRGEASLSSSETC